MTTLGELNSPGLRMPPDSQNIKPDGSEPVMTNAGK
jgi:hypothetical protein